METPSKGQSQNLTPEALRIMAEGAQRLGVDVSGFDISTPEGARIVTESFYTAVAKRKKTLDRLSRSAQ